MKSTAEQALGLAYQVMCAVETMAMRMGMKGECEVAFKRGLDLNPIMIVDWKKPEGLVIRAKCNINLSFIVSPVVPAGLIDDCVSGMEKQFRSQK